MDACIVPNADYADPTSEDRYDSDHNNYNPDSNPYNDRNDGFGVCYGVGVAV